MSDYEAVIGLEVHAQLNTESKIFCSDPTTFGKKANTQVSPVSLGLPGTLPVLNREALYSIIKAGLTFGCKIAQRSKFDRKNYFYPDLPKAYQISQYDMPICQGGFVQIDMDGNEKSVQLNRIHLEEDAGKLMHSDYDGHGSAVDYNRAGIPLVEIVSEPDMHSADEAYEYLVSLKRSLKYLNISDCNMEEGSLRCDANVSIRPCGSKELGTKSEVKNLNSFHGVKKAIQYEIQRQTRCVEKGERVVQETRLWDTSQLVTRSMRSKEEAHDYRYFPDPDLPPLHIDESLVDQLRKQLPEAPLTRKKRFKKDYQLNDYDAGVLIGEKELADYFEEACQIGGSPKNICNWITSELLAALKEAKIDLGKYIIRPCHISQLVQLIESGKITGKIGKIVFLEMTASGQNPETIVKEKSLVQIQDQNEIEKIIDQVIEQNPKPVDDVKSGKKNALGFLVGQVMKLSKGKANPQIVNDLLNKKL